MISRIEMEYMEAVKKMAREMSKPKEIDWEQRRWDLVCHISQGLFAGNRSWSPLEAVRCADEIIAAYKDEQTL